MQSESPELHQLADIRFFPFAKAAAEAADAGDGPWIFEGIASDESEDVEGDEILRRSLDLSYADSRGFVNWDHGKGPEDQIGFLQSATLISPKDVPKFEERLGVKLSKSASVHVRGELYQYMPQAEATANLLKSAPLGRGVGLSLQGALARDPADGDILKAFVRGIAITPVPAHPNTMATLVKSLSGSAPKAGVSASDSISPVSDEVRQYVDGRLEEFRRSIHPEPQRLTTDEAILMTLRRWPNLPYEAAERFVTASVSLATKEH